MFELIIAFEKDIIYIIYTQHIILCITYILNICPNRLLRARQGSLLFFVHLQYWIQNPTRTWQ
jgi:hypothetical protein